MSTIKFYSKNDMSCGAELDKIIEKINYNYVENDWGISDVLDFHNILKFIHIEKFSSYLASKTGINIESYEKKINMKIGKFLGENKGNYLLLYSNEGIDYTEDYLEIMEIYKIFEHIGEESFCNFIEENSIPVFIIMKFKNIVKAYDSVMMKRIMSSSQNLKIVLSKYFYKEEIYLPKDLGEEEISELINDYIDSEEVDISILREVINFPNTKGINISDRIKLNAKKRCEEEEEKLFTNGTGIETGIKISYPTDQEDALIFTVDNMIADIKISRKWIEENLDFPTLWNNFIYVFGFVDNNMRLQFDSKQTEIGIIESVMTPKAEHLYLNSYSFMIKEMLADAEIYSYSRVIALHDIRIEEMIEWFFTKYILSEFHVSYFVVKMPSITTTFFEKCRIILPEIDRIFKQYAMLIEYGNIDQELLQMSSSSVKNKDIKSFSNKKYVYSSSSWYDTASFLLFSDQSHIFYRPTRQKQYDNFFKLISAEKLKLSDFQEYQIQNIKWLIVNNIIHETTEGVIEFRDLRIIYILKELYYEEVINYWRCPKDIRSIIDELAKKELVIFENSLFTRNEQDYFDYYLNKSKFTNGLDIRNRYIHGTNANEEEQYRKDYYTILKLLVIIVIKTNDDLCIRSSNHLCKTKAYN